MRVSANAISLNERGEVLLILRDDLRVWSVPGGMLDPNEAPATAVVREVREETGLEVQPIQLVGLQFWPLSQSPTLEFNYLCQVQAGDLRPSPESPQVGFFAPTDLPRPMLPAREELITTALAPVAMTTWQAHRLSWGTQLGWWWLRHVTYPLKNWRRKRQGNPYLPPPTWQVVVRLVVQDEQGRTLWLKPGEGEPWQWPGCVVAGSDAPWETARRVIGRMTALQLELRRLLNVETQPTGCRLTLTFAAEAIGPDRREAGQSGCQMGYFWPGQEPEDIWAEQFRNRD